MCEGAYVLWIAETFNQVWSLDFVMGELSWLSTHSARLFRVVARSMGNVCSGLVRSDGWRYDNCPLASLNSKYF
jgi:hypothetical protein